LVGTFLCDALLDRQPALVIATNEHRLGILRQLTAQGVDVEQAERAGDLVLRDADDVLSRFMDEQPNEDLFRQTVMDFQQAWRDRTKATIHIYTEIVNVMWRDGRGEVATRVERLWNKLCSTTDDFSLLCGYAMGSFYKQSELSNISDWSPRARSQTGTQRRLEPGYSLDRKNAVRVPPGIAPA
jgi:hypothetical protein